MKKMLRKAFWWLILRSYLAAAVFVLIMLGVVFLDKTLILFGWVMLIVLPIAIIVNYQIFKHFLESDKKNYSIYYDNITPLKLWWWYTWRVMIVLYLLQFIVETLNKVEYSWVRIGANLLFTILTFYIQYYYIKELFTKQHKNFRIELVEFKPAEYKEQAE